MPPIYLDHNATTPIDPSVVDAMLPLLRENFGNPASTDHWHGHQAYLAVETARAQVARAVGAKPDEIIFTGSCTEANNLAILGHAAANPAKKHLITTAVEHPAVLEPCRHLERAGYELTLLPVDETGRVNPEAVQKAIRTDTLLVSVMAANNEVGTVQPIDEIGRICEQLGTTFHSDMAQVPAYMAVDVHSTRLHLASLSAHKVYGPKGVGALFIRGRRPRVKLASIQFGGGQERGLRSGTVASHMVVGMGHAFEIAAKRRTVDASRLRTWCFGLLDAVTSRVSGVVLNGHPQERLPNNLSLSIEQVDPMALMRLLREDLSFSSASACATDQVQTSHVLLAMLGNTSRARSAFRVAPGRFTTDEELSIAADLIVAAVERLRRMAA